MMTSRRDIDEVFLGLLWFRRIVVSFNFQHELLVVPDHHIAAFNKNRKEGWHHPTSATHGHRSIARAQCQTNRVVRTLC